jgi:DNA end-binding protein Ku
MAARPTWKGHLKLSLVSCPIVLYPATSSSERTAFRQINLKTRNRLRQQLIDDQTKEVVEAADKGRGLEIAKNVYLPVTDEEIDSVAIESSHTVSIEPFVRHDTIDDRYHDTPYYVAPDEDGDQEAFSVIREAMRGKGVVALARIVLNKRERIVMIQPLGRRTARNDTALCLRGTRRPHGLRGYRPHQNRPGNARTCREIN